MSNGLIGAILGIILGVVGVFQGLGAALLVAVLGLVGWCIGHFVKIDLSALGQKIERLLSNK